jgi:transposase
MNHDKARTLTDSEWVFAHEELSRAGAACNKHPSFRGIVDAILWVSQYETSWTALPSHYPPHGTCYGALYRWKLAGLIQPIFHTLGAKLPAGQLPGVKNRPQPSKKEIAMSPSWFPQIDDA